MLAEDVVPGNGSLAPASVDLLFKVVPFGIYVGVIDRYVDSLVHV